MKRFYLELNGAFVKDSNYYKTILKAYQNAIRNSKKDDIVLIFDSLKCEHFSPDDTKKTKIFVGKILDSEETIERTIDEKLSDKDYLYFKDSEERFSIEEEEIQSVVEDDPEERWDWVEYEIESYEIVER